MAYQLKYYKDIDSHGHLWRVEIYQDTDQTLTPVEIGPVVQGLRLVMQGDQADVDTPIVKTSLEMVFVDAPDLEDERKCGYWEEFYTSSATEYKVVLKKDGWNEWAGYITPDSFSEDLRYRGSVSIVARDGLGSLQDFDFDLIGDESGLVSLRQLIAAAWDVLPIPMQYNILDSSGHRRVPSDAETGKTIYDVLFNTAALRELNWWEALEKTLYSCGVAIRYVRGQFSVVSVRSLGLWAVSGFWGDNPVRDARFLAFGRRELSPAAKAVEEVINFEITEKLNHTELPPDAFGISTGGFQTEYDGYIFRIPVFEMVGTQGVLPCSAEDSLLLNPFAFPYNKSHRYSSAGEIKDPSVLYIASNGTHSDTEPSRAVGFVQNFQTSGTYKIQFTVDRPVSLYDNDTTIGYAGVHTSPAYIGVRGIFEGADGSVQYLDVFHEDSANWKWTTSNSAASGSSFFLRGEFPFTVQNLPELVTTAPGTLKFFIRYIQIAAGTGNRPDNGRGFYTALKNFEIQIKSTDSSEGVANVIRFNTQYSRSNNVVLRRDPEFGPNPSAILSAPLMITNGIFLKRGDTCMGPQDWRFIASAAPLPLPVLIHQQLLAFYSKPNNVLTGELVTNDPTFDALYQWGGTTHMLTSGTLNILTGRMESAVLREFRRYDHMWETWPEVDDLRVDYPATIVDILIHSEQDLTEMMSPVAGVPAWMSVQLSEDDTNLYNLDIVIDANHTGEERHATIYIDGAPIRIRQSAAGDYGIDYNEDYS